VISIEERKAIRRANVVRLLDQYGQTRLSELTGIAPALLYQFGRAKGKSKRNVNDNYARAIEQALGLSPGWMDIDHGHARETQQPAASSSMPESRWPFSFRYERWERLSAAQKRKIEEIVEGMITAFEHGSVPSAQKSRVRRVAG
jgi:hypothetical protein